MRRAITAAAVMTSCALFQSGAYDAARETAIAVLEAALVEAELTSVCEEAARQQREDSKTSEEAKTREAAVWARCDYAWGLYDNLKASQDELISALESARAAQVAGQEYDEGQLVVLMLRVQADLIAFQRAAAAIGA